MSEHNTKGIRLEDLASMARVNSWPGIDVAEGSRKFLDVMSRLKYSLERFDFYKNAEDPENLVASARSEWRYLVSQSVVFKIVRDLKKYEDYLDKGLFEFYNDEILDGLKRLREIASGDFSRER